MTTQSASRTCDKCGAAVPEADGWRFCPACGASLAASACPQCSAPLPAGARFCHRCGAPAPGAELQTTSASGAHSRMPWAVAGVALLALLVMLAARASGL